MSVNVAVELDNSEHLAPDVGPPSDNKDGGHGRTSVGLAGLVVGSVGVVYGDIGTSPIYAFREALKAATMDGALTRAEIFGVTSLILWALILIVTVKYVLILLHADNKGEGERCR